MNGETLKPVMRHYRGEDDYSRIRSFLQETMILNGLMERNWHVARLDYQRWHGILNLGEPPLEETTFIWEKDGTIAGVITAESKFHVFPNIHPKYEGSEMFGEMLAVAESHNVGMARDGGRKLIVWVNSKDRGRHEVLGRRGFLRVQAPDASESQNRADLDRELPNVPLATGYSIRSLRGIDDLPGRAWCSWRAFHPHEPEGNYDGFSWYRNIQAIPNYREDLDMVVVTGEDEIVSFCTIWYDEMTRTAYFEPVGTMPEHRGKGLARANLVEGLRRLKKLGCKRAFVGGYADGANALYKSAGFTEHDISEAWEKIFD